VKNVREVFSPQGYSRKLCQTSNLEWNSAACHHKAQCVDAVNVAVLLSPGRTNNLLSLVLGFTKRPDVSNRPGVKDLWWVL